MDAVVKILRIALMEAERKIAEATINVPHVVEEHALDVVPDQGNRSSTLLKNRASPPSGKPVG